MKKTKDTKAQWKVNTPQLLKEILVNNETQALRIPLRIFGEILYELGESASEINDPKLNALMCRLALYEISDPYNKSYDSQLTNDIIEKGK